MTHNTKIIICGISVDFYQDERYVLSTSPDKLIFPSFAPESLVNPKQSAIEYVRSLCVNKEEALEYLQHISFISITNDHISKLFYTQDVLYLLYGTTLPHLALVDSTYWHKFNFMDINIANELSIIGETIAHAI